MDNNIAICIPACSNGGTCNGNTCSCGPRFSGNFCQVCNFDDDIRLEGGSANTEGRVELCMDGSFGTVCNNDWDNVDASIVCRQLGFQASGESWTRNLKL